MAFCPYCGSEYNPDLMICPICGKKISAGLQKRVKAAPEGEWVRATMIPLRKIISVVAIAILIASLVVFAVWAFSGNGIFSSNQPTEPSGAQGTKPTETSTTEPQPTGSTTTPTEPITGSTDQTTVSTEPSFQPSTTSPVPPTTGSSESTTNPTEPSTDPTEPSTDPTGPSTNPAEPSIDPTEPSNAKIVGTWVGKANATEMFNQKLLEAYPSFGAYLFVDKFEVMILLSFTEDGTMSYWADQGTFVSQIGNYRGIWIAGITQYVRDKFHASPTIYKELTGSTIEETVDKVIASLQGKNVQAMTSSSVSYSCTGDRLILGNNMGQFTIALTETALRMTSYSGVHQNASLERIMVNTVFYK